MGNTATGGMHAEFRAGTEDLLARQEPGVQETIRASARKTVIELAQAEVPSDTGRYPDGVLLSIAQRAAAYALETTLSERKGE